MHLKYLKRFWSKVNLYPGITKKDCWNWKAGLKDSGYGWFRTSNGNRAASRVIYEHFNGTIHSQKLQVMHKCNNPKCVNPSHLELGTQKDNQMFATISGRSNGQQRPLLDEREQIAVRFLDKCSFPARDLAALFKISTPTMYDIIKRKGAYS